MILIPSMPQYPALPLSPLISLGLTITAFNAGHTLGGTIWKIRSRAVGVIVYAVNMNYIRERHLDGTVLISGPAVLSSSR
ncbi:hypothetical protein BGY98DRAFT_1052192 [Russula aff. rugulosa BPL654]|nr:hypothetical protein BGY98DRAFT_1052192 [Russula aff. rugulosa BPL654]